MKVRDLKVGQEFKESDIQNARFAVTDEREYVIWDTNDTSRVVIANDGGNGYGKVTEIVKGRAAEILVENLKRTPVTCSHCGKIIATIDKTKLDINRIHWLESMIGHAHNNVCPATRENIPTLPETYLVVEGLDKTLREVENDLLREIPNISTLYCGDFVMPQDEDDPIWTGEPYELEISTYDLENEEKRFVERYFNLPQYSLFEVDGIKVR